MLLIPTYIGPSNIDGIGLFAAQGIKVGTVIWKFTPPFDLKFNKKILRRLNKYSKIQLINFSYLSESGDFVLCADNARFINHSIKPNTINIGFDQNKEGVTIALRNILKGEEITSNYSEFDPTENLDSWLKRNRSPSVPK